MIYCIAENFRGSKIWQIAMGDWWILNWKICGHVPLNPSKIFCYNIIIFLLYGNMLFHYVIQFLFLFYFLTYLNNNFVHSNIALIIIIMMMMMITN